MTEEGANRRLAAILAADVAGYTRLMESDEDATLAAWWAARKDIIDPSIAGHGGRIVKHTGDGFLAEFATATAAVRCAVAMQVALTARNADTPEDRRFDFRMGINLGEIVVDEEDIYGDGVNIAARIESLAESGSIWVSANVHEQVHKKLDVAFRDMGEHTVKNLSAPIRAYCVVLGEEGGRGSEAKAAGETALTLPDKPSIAVLPFDNLSGDPEQEFFADGMAEDIITGLLRYRWFFVIARNSSFTYKDRAVDVKQVASELGVRYVLEGSVRKAGNRVRVAAQLIDATTGRHIWAERYDRELGDIFALQDEITDTIIAAIEPELGATERERARRKPPENLDAWDSYQRGLSHFHGDVTGGERPEAKRWLQRACELDPTFAAAYGVLAWIHTIDINLGSTDDPEASLEAAAQAAEKAIALDPKDPDAHVALGRVYMFRHAHERAIVEMETAISLNPSFDRGHYGLGLALLYGGRPAEAIPHFERAIRLNPRGWRPWVYPQMLARTYFNLGKYEEAAAWCAKAIRYPNAPFQPFCNAAATLGHLGRIDEARAMLAEVKKRKPDFSADTVMSTVGLYGQYSGADRIIDGLRKAGLSD